jgi:hypothetical protein
VNILKKKREYFEKKQLREWWLVEIEAEAKSPARKYSTI